MKKKVLNSFLFHHGRAFVVFLIITLTLGILAYFYSGIQVEKRTAEQMLHREQVISRAGARSIESFISLTKKSFLVLSRNPNLFADSEKTHSVLNNFLSDWEGTPLTGVILIDKEGKVSSVATKEITQEESEMDFSGRDYFVWARDADEGEVYVGQPVISRVGTTKGEFIITLATPLRYNGEFKGVLVSAILVSKLTENYLEPLKVSDQSKVYLVDSSGLVVYSDITPILGLNFFDYLEEHPFVGSDTIISVLRERIANIMKEHEGKIEYIRNDYDNKTNFRKWLLTYATVNIATTAKQENWILAVETPNEDALLFANMLFRYQTYVLIFCIVSIISLVVIAITSAKIREREAFLKGFSEGKKVGRGKENKH